MRALFLIALAFPTLAQNVAPMPVRIRVVNSLTRAPLPSALVTIAGSQGSVVAGASNIDGLFSTRLPVGQYAVSAELAHYRAIHQGSTIDVNASDVEAVASADIVLELLPLGILTGRVVDQNGDPVQYANVDSLEPDGHRASNRAPYESAGAKTDDRGRYRIVDVPPGAHSLKAAYRQSDVPHGGVLGSRSPWPESGGAVTFPGTLDITAGGIVEVPDLKVTIAPGVTISGMITGGALDSRTVRFEGADTYTEHVLDDGRFSLQVVPGRYLATAWSPHTGEISRSIEVDAREKNVTGLKLEVLHGYEIRARVELQGPGNLDPSTLRIKFSSHTDIVDDEDVDIRQDGTFHTFLGNSSTTYVVEDLPEDWYVKQFTLNGRIITGNHFEVERGTSEVVVLLHSAGARLDVRVPGLGAVPSAIVFLLPDKGPMPDLEAIIHGEAEGAGPYVMRGVPPGAYRVFALSETDVNRVFSPAMLMEKYRAQAPLITLGERERKTMTVPLAKFPRE